MTASLVRSLNTRNIIDFRTMEKRKKDKERKKERGINKSFDEDIRNWESKF